MNRFVYRPALILLLILLPSLGWSAPLTGEDLFKSLGCLGCHQVKGNGGSLGPALDQVSQRLAPDQLRRILTVRRKDSVMPSYDYLTEPELATLLDYLKTL